VRRALLAIAAIAASIFAAGPVLWQLVTSLRTDQEMLDIGLPTTLTLDSYRAAFETQPLGRAMLNSLAVASTTTAACILLGAAAAFVLAKLDLRGGHAVLVAALLTSMFPSVAAVGSLYLGLRALGLYDHLLGLVLPYAGFALPTTLWILHGFFRQIPDEIYRAAIIDGCTPLQAFWKVMLPLAAPGLATTAVLVFISAWNEFLFALTLIASPQLRTVPVAIAMFAGEHEEPWGEIAAASVVATLPVMLVALLCQRWIVRGLTAGAVKG
jgi:multiple sugar transport system permease protein